MRGTTMHTERKHYFQPDWLQPMYCQHCGAYLMAEQHARLRDIQQWRATAARWGAAK